ncbi:MAG: CRISPR-associated protein Cas1, partial [Kamptonema sp. SIO4C4]|nr:CRISPR-associated protein Cas1 [Kamptonema sp. SIO4C4]
MEQFRPLVERWVWQNWSPVHSGCSLDQWEGFLQHSVTHPYGGVMSLRSCLGWQVREYVTAVTEGTAYRPFLLLSR